MAAKKVVNEEPSEDYDIVPHKRLMELQRQVADLKKSPYGSTDAGKEMKQTMDNLSQSMNDLMGIFKDAAQEMKMEEHDVNVISKGMKPLMQRLDEVVEQNKKIARGIVAIADMVKEQNERLEETHAAPRGMMMPPRRPRGPMPGAPHPPGKHVKPPGPPGKMPPPPGMFPSPGRAPEHGASMMPPPPSSPGGPLPPPPGMGKKKKGWFG